ncbi:MAG TPA: hypothetical protein VME67_20130 [Mycobacterium sp.]|nr:hypothetical protein [Mycobacterium sp.]HTX96950.1 hypothetical protein [Mycobacterium sp.]
MRPHGQTEPIDRLWLMPDRYRRFTIAEDASLEGGMATEDLEHLIEIGMPSSTPHWWVELFVDRRWMPFDPHAIHMMVRHGGLDATQWPPQRPAGAIPAGFTRDQADLVAGLSVSVPLMVVTEQVQP